MSDRKYTPKDFYVYVHRKATTGEPFYVGKGRDTRAWDTHGRSRWWRGIHNKHGVVVGIVQDGLQEWAAFELERDTIALYGRKQDDAGPLINGTDGGEGTSGATRSQHTKKLMSEKRRAFLAQTPQYREHTSAKIKHLWHNSPMGDNIRRSRRKNQGKPAMCLDTGTVFGSYADVAEWIAASTGKRAPSIAQILTAVKNGGATVHGFYISGLSAVEANDAASRHAAIEKIRASHAEARTRAAAAQKEKARATSKRIRCVETGQEFSSQAEAAEWCRANGHANAKYSHICNVLAGRGSTAYGFHWQRV